MTTLALHITTNGEVKELDSIELETLQKSVGGWVQAIGLRPDLTLWLNEESKLLGLPHNQIGQAFWDNVFGEGTDYISGDVVFTGGTDEDGETLALSDDIAEAVRRRATEILA